MLLVQYWCPCVATPRCNAVARTTTVDNASARKRGYGRRAFSDTTTAVGSSSAIAAFSTPRAVCVHIAVVAGVNGRRTMARINTLSIAASPSSTAVRQARATSSVPMGDCACGTVSMRTTPARNPTATYTWKQTRGRDAFKLAKRSCAWAAVDTRDSWRRYADTEW